MSFIGLIYSINSLVCLSIGLPLNFILLGLILRYTEKEMRLYSRLVLQTCIADIIYLAIHALIQQIYLVVDGVSLIIANGPIRHFGNPMANICYAIWNFLFYFSVIGLTAQFVYRYFVLCRGIQSHNLLYIFLLASVIAVDAGVFVWMEFIFYGQPHQQFVTNELALRILNDGPTQNENDAPQKWLIVAFTDNNQLSNLLWLSSYWLLNMLSYILMFICARRINAFLAKNLSGSSNKSKLKIQRQISKTLFLQAAIPGLILLSILFGAPLGFLPSSNGPNGTLLFVEMLLSIPLNWLPVLNPIVTIFTINAYRKTLTRLCSCGKIHLANSTSKTHAIAQNDPAPKITSTVSSAKKNWM